MFEGIIYKFSVIIVGLAFVGSICDGSNSTSVIEGNHLLTFTAVVATHELGHRLLAYLILFNSLKLR